MTIEQLDHVPRISEFAIVEVGSGRSRVHSSLLKQTAAEKVGILPGESSEFVDEAFDGQKVDSISTPRQAPRVKPLGTGT